MALKAKLETNFGENRDLYIRINNAEINNHGVKSRALFRAYLSEEAFDTGKGYVWEREVEFMADVALPVWPQAYAALQALPDMPPGVAV